MNAKVADLMAVEVVGIQRHHTVEHARETMRRYGIHALPVVDSDGTPAGIVSSQDLATDLKNETPISSVMTREVFTIPPYNDVHHAARLMRNRGIHHVIVTEEQKVVGLLSSFDLLKLVEQHRFVMKPGPTPSRKQDRRV
ncbi:MAG: HPP family protein [Rubrobacteraceae bacterium]